MLPATEDRNREIARLETAHQLDPGRALREPHAWQRVLVARHPARPTTLDYVERLFTDFVETARRSPFRRRPRDRGRHGRLQRTRPCWWSATRRAATPSRRSTGTSATRARRATARRCALMSLAEKFGRPIVCFVDTPAAYPGIESEERGVAEAIAVNLREMAMLEVPVVIVVHGEGGSGGALGIAVGDRVLMHEFAIYSVIPPGGLRGHPVARLGPQGRGRRGAEDHRARPAAAGHHRRDRLRAGRRRAHRSRTGRRPLLDVALDRAWPRSSALGAEVRLEAALPEVPRDGQVGIDSSRDSESRDPQCRGAKAQSDSPYLADPRVSRPPPQRRCSASWASRRSPRGCWPFAATTTPTRRAASSTPSLRSPARPVPADGHGRAVDRLLSAPSRSRERIAVHGDYDVDGITSTVILRRALELLGADVVHFMPERRPRRLRPAAGHHRSTARRGRPGRSCRWTAASVAPRPRGAPASWGWTSSSPTITSPTTSCRRRWRS